MKPYLTVFCSITVTIIIAIILTGCTDLQTSSANNTEVVIDGKHYKVELKEVTPSIPTDNMSTPTPTEHPSSIKPPITNRIITSQDGVIYLTDFPSYGDTLRVSWYWVKENGYWAYHKEMKDFPLNVDIKSYPQGGEYGDLRPQSDMKYYLTMPDGTKYATRYEILPISLEVIRISNYFQQDRGDERWYFHTEPIDLPKKDARIQQVKP